MILMRLLSAGKTLVGVTTNERSYQLPQEGAMPRFKGKKNPFRATTLPEKPRCAGEEKEVVKASGLPILENVATNVEISPASPETAPPLRESAASQNEKELSVAGRGQRWMARLKKLVATPSPRIFAAPEKNSRPAQGELRLESVQVMRNDLTESDIEIVPKEQALKDLVNRSPGSPAVVAVKSVTDTAWSRVSARIFGPDSVG